MVKVLHLIANSARSPYLRAIADHADRRRFDLRVGALTPPGGLQEDMGARGVTTFALGCGGRKDYPLAVFRLARWLRRERVDVVQTHLYDANLVGAVAARLAGTPLVLCTEHHSHEVVLQSAVRRRRLTYLLNRVNSVWLCHRVISPSRCINDVLLRAIRVPPRRVVTIPYGYDFSALRPSPGARDRIRAEFGLGDAPVVGAVGRLYWVKNQALLLTAFARLLRAAPRVKLLLVGDGPERQALRRRAEELGVAGHVVFTGFRGDVHDLYAAMDVFAHASLGEAFCQATSEAAAHGKPIVSTDVGGAEEVVEDGVSGRLVPPGDVEAFAAALLEVAGAPHRWGAMGEAGRARVSRFSAERMVRSYEALYVTCLSTR